jgi:hypothetical protein
LTGPIKVARDAVVRPSVAASQSASRPADARLDVTGDQRFDQKSLLVNGKQAFSPVPNGVYAL